MPTTPLPFHADSHPDNLSALVWQSMLSQLTPTISENNPSSISYIPPGLRLSQWQGWEAIWPQPDDHWVALYEQTQARLARQNRKKKGELQQGVFYTPEPMARYLVRQTLGVFLQQRYQAIAGAILENQVQAAQTLVDEVQGVKVIDPACGTGVFLVAALQCLSEFYQRLQEQFTTIHIEGNAQFAIRHQLYGIDIDPLSVAITECRLWQWAHWLEAQDRADESFFTHTNLMAATLMAADTLNASPFPDLRWQFIVGNPPFVSEVRKQAERFKALQHTDFYQAKMDVCDAFTAWAIQHLSPNGQLAYVLPIYWMQRTSSQSLRTLLWETGRFRQLWRFGDSPIFKNAPGHHPSLLLWQKSLSNLKNVEKASRQSIQWGTAETVESLSESGLSAACILNDARSGKFVVGEQQTIDLLHRLSDLHTLIPEKAIQQGIVLPQGRLKKSDWRQQTPSFQAQFSQDAGIFLLTDAEVAALSFNDFERALLKPYYGPTGFLPFQGFQQNKALYQLIYTDAPARKKIATHPDRYSNLRAHLDRFAPVLTAAFKPYGLHRPRQPHWFENPCKTLCPRQVPYPAFAVVEHPAYVSEGFYILQPENAGQAHFWTALLNSQLGWFWLYHQKRKGQRLQIDKDVLQVFPQPPSVTEAAIETLATISQKLAQPVSALERKTLLNRLNKQVFQLYQCSPEEVACVRAAYNAMGFA
ncbi:Eco57I restriction-modification methylase domain-containing protein [Vampirovibrio chlorellavorus]|uniref:Eco57I restriction-modification methylase domain-containing protein n=1 Tax=Vampirovibrio chlorellavorus TaxID=758823 RepID=UPI0026EABF1B|nr:DNA methyltransferase [Vampirovibrio chlorellavorus]